VASWGIAAAALLSAAEPELVWPEEWVAFGPIPSKTAGTSLYGRPRKEDLLPGERLKAISQELVIDGRQYRGQPLRPEKGLLDLGRKYNCTGDGMGAYLLAPVTVAADTTVQIGAGADWWMQWWVDGRPVYDTLVHGHAGNGVTPISGRDHVFSVKLSKGRHVLAVAVFGYRRFLLAVTSPEQLGRQPLGFAEVMASGRRKYRPPHWSIAVSYSAARTDFERALQLAGADAERAEALLAVAESYLVDGQNLSVAEAGTIRKHCVAAMALQGAREEQKARALLGLAEASLLEDRPEQARQELARARELSSKPGWAGTVQLAEARALIQERKDAAARTILKSLLEAANRDPLLRFNARTLLEALEVAPRIRPDHPRLFFNAEMWPAVKARIERDAQGLKRLRHAANGLPKEPEVKDWGRDLMPAALVYRVTSDPALLARIRKLLRATVDHYLLLQDFNAHVESRVGCAAALDWVWNDLPPAERDGLAHDLVRYAYGRHLQDLLQGVGRADHDPYYYAGNMHWYIALATLAPDVPGPDTLRVLAVLGRGYDNNVTACFGKNLERMKDRGGVTKLEYNFVDLPTPTWTFLHCWRSSIGPVPGEWAFASGIAPSYVLRNVLGARRGEFRDFGYSKSWRKSGGWNPGAFLGDHLGQFIYFFSQSEPEEATIAAWLRQRMQQEGCAGAGTYPIYPYTVDLGNAPPPKLPAGLPLARLYAGFCGQLLMSSGFDRNSTYALFSCGGRDGQAVSEHFDAGHFTIFKQGFLALDSGTRALLQPDPTSGENYDRQSVAHNTVLIRMPGERMTTLESAIQLQANSGGQCKLPRFARVLAFETNRLFAYAATDATPTYHPDKCAQMVRQFVFLTPDHFVVFDRVVATKADYSKTWLLHTANEPAITGNEFRADQMEGRIFCRTLYPPDAVLEKIGGPGKEFWADGRNWPIPAHSPYLRNLGIASASDVAENMGRWRVEVKPGAPRADDVFLHLIQVSDQTVTKMAESRVSDLGEHIALTFKAGARTCTIGLNKTGNIGGHIRIEEGGQAVIDKDLARDIQPQTGLALTE